MLCEECDRFRFPPQPQPLVRTTRHNKAPEKASSSASNVKTAGSTDRVSTVSGDVPVRSSDNSSTQKGADSAAAQTTPTSANSSSDNIQKSMTIVSSSSRFDDATSVTRIVWNELLAYVNFYRNWSSNEALCRVVAGFFSPDDILTAKNYLSMNFCMSMESDNSPQRGVARQFVSLMRRK